MPVPAPTIQPLNPAAVQQLLDMGFPESEVNAALRAANGNSDMAVEFLMSGIPEQTLLNMANTNNNASAGASAVASRNTDPLESFRNTGEFDRLRRIVQQNPGELTHALEDIGRANPPLLAAIHGNQERFLQMMNEPVTSAPLSPAQPMGGAGGPMGNPAMLLQLLQALPPAQRTEAARNMGMTPEQLQAFTQMLATMPPEQLQALMSSYGGGMGGGDAEAVPPGANVIRLTDEEMASVSRLTELGFDQQDALAAYLACEKNESLAANLLLEGWSAGDGQGDAMDGGFDGGDDMYS